ncbi:MAG: SMP-30/gluconolactonase/LRE family protein [Dehalococcoidia bacterium]|nr:SMP-30/gluconolactonase/LRE family protein [Dehalococcoidia bacterium]
MPIEKLAPGLERIVSLDQDIEWLGSGFNLAEGPLWWKEGGYFLFSDVLNNRRMKWSPRDGVTEFLKPTNYANGLTRDRQGRLIACEHGGNSPADPIHRVTRMEPDGTLTVVANNYRGHQLNRPNDVVVKSDGAIYFTDPVTFNLESELDFFGVYRVSPDLGTIHLLVRDFVMPNGLAFSPDEKVLYINDSRRRHIRAFDLQAMSYGIETGLLNPISDRVFCDLSGERPGIPDGMKVDVEGHVYCGGSGGIWIMDPTGKHLGTIPLPTGQSATNMAWGGDDWKTLFITARETVGRIHMKIAGIPVPRGHVA